MKIQNASKDIKKGGNLFPSSKTSYIEENTQKDKQTSVYVRENTMGHLKHVSCAPSVQKNTLGRHKCEAGALSVAKLQLGAQPCAPSVG